MADISLSRETPGFNAGQGIGQLIAALIHRRGRNAFQAQPLGQVLGYPGSPEQAPMVGPLPPPMPTVGPDMSQVRPMLPTGRTAFPTAPEAMQPMLSKPVGDLAKLNTALGANGTLTNIMSGLGVGRGQADAMQLEMGPDGTFRIKPGTTGVSSRNANVLLRQKDLKNKSNLQDWRAAVEERLKRGQLSREETIALKSDSDLLDLMVSPQFDLMDDTIKQQLTAQATAAINRLQQRGVKVFTGSRADAAAGTPAPTPGTPPVKPPPAPAPMSPEQRYSAIKAANPKLTDQEIYSQMAIEDASK